MKKVTLKKSLIAAKPNQIKTAESLGLRKIGDCIVHEDNAVLAGKIRGLTQTDANVSVSIAHDHQCREAGNTTTLDRLGYTVQADERFLQLVLARIELVSHFCFLSF